MNLCHETTFLTLGEVTCTSVSLKSIANTSRKYDVRTFVVVRVCGCPRRGGDWPQDVGPERAEQRLQPGDQLTERRAAAGRVLPHNTTAPSVTVTTQPQHCRHTQSQHTTIVTTRHRHTQRIASVTERRAAGVRVLTHTKRLVTRQYTT